MTSAPSFKKTKPSSRPRIRNSFSQDRRRAPRVAPDPLQEILDGATSTPTARARRVQKYKRTLRPTRRAVAEFIYHYHGELNHQGLGNAFVFLDTTRS